MASLEQLKLLETKVIRMNDYVQKLTEEKASLKGELDSSQKKIQDLEVLIQHFREDQNQIEDSILSALDRLNKFEDALESTISRDKDAPTGGDPGDSGPDKDESAEAEEESGGELDIF